MRKFLSLVLALVMTMSLVTISAGAKDFADNDVIDYDEAVAVISALNVVDGYADGTFNPNGNLTRQAASKIICNLILGPTTAKALKADVAPFPDVPTDSEFAGYIAYCASRGIIGGYADGTFNPGGSLTGNAFMKMLLGALGYDSSIEGFGGPNWTINVGKLAMGLGLEDGLLDGFDGGKTVTRQEAALYSMNTLEATMVDYGQKIVITDANGNPQVVGHADATPVAEGGYKSYNGGADKTLQFCERYFQDLSKGTTRDDFGRPAHIWKLKTTEIGTWNNTTDLLGSWTGTVSKDAMYNALGQNVIDNLTDSSQTNAKLYYFVDGKEVTTSGTKTAADIAKFASRRNTSNMGKDYNVVNCNSTGNGALTEVYLDKDSGRVDIVTINTFVYQATSDYNSTRDNIRFQPVGDTSWFGYTLKEGTTLSGDDFDIEDVKEDDYLLLTVAWNDTNYDVVTVTPAEVVTGEVTALDGTSKITMDGTVYSFARTARVHANSDDAYTTGDDTDTGVRDTLPATGTKAALVLDTYGNIIAIDDSVVSGNYVFITQAKDTTGFSNVLAQAYFTDGTTADITVKKAVKWDGSKYVGTTNRGEMSVIKGWFAYTVDSDGRYTLTGLPTTYTSNTVVDDGTKTSISHPVSGNIVTAGNVTLPTVDGVSARATDRTLYVIVDKDGDVSTYTGAANVPTVKADNGQSAKVGYIVRNGYATHVFISVNGLDGGDVENTNANDTYILLYGSATTQVVGSTTYYKWSAIKDGAKETLLINDSTASAGMYRRARMDASTDRIASLVPFDQNGTTRFVHNLSSPVELSYKDGTLKIGSNSYLVGSANLNLVTTASSILKPGSTRDVYESISGGNINSILGDNNYVTGTAWVVVSEQGRQTATNVYLSIGSAMTQSAAGDVEAADTAAVAAAKAAVDVTAVTSTKVDENLADRDAAKTYLENQIAEILAAVSAAEGVIAEVEITDFTAAGASTVDADGADGKFSATITLTKGSAEQTVTVTNREFVAAPFEPQSVDDFQKVGAKNIAAAATAATSGDNDPLPLSAEIITNNTDLKTWAEAQLNTIMNPVVPAVAGDPEAGSKYWVEVGSATLNEEQTTVTCSTVKVAYAVNKPANFDDAQAVDGSVVLNVEYTKNNEEKAQADIDAIQAAIDGNDAAVAGFAPSAADSSATAKWDTKENAYAEVEAIIEALLKGEAATAPYTAITVIHIDNSGDTTEGSWSPLASENDEAIFLVTITYGEGAKAESKTIEITVTMGA